MGTFNMKWVKHDTDANQDAKLQNVLLDYGLEGYGLYWYCIELIAGKVGKENITFELEHDARVIARNTGSTTQKVEEMMKYFVTVNLFENTNGVVTCLKLAKRLDQSMTSNPEMRGIISNLKSHDKVMIKSDKVMQDYTRLDKTKGEETKDITPVAKAPVEQKKRFIAPLATEVYDYMIEKQLTIEEANEQSDRFHDFYGSKGWMVGKNKMKNWKMAVNNWVRSNKPVNNSSQPDLSSTDWAGNKVFDPTYLER